MADLLFNRRSMFDYLEGRQQEARNAVNAVPESRLSNENDQDLIEMLVAEVRIHPMDLSEESIRQDPPREIDIQVPDWDGQRVTVRGTSISVYLPFSGDPQLFGVTPTRNNYNPPRAEVRSGEVLIKWEGRAAETAQAKASVDQTLQALRTYSGWSREDVENFNSGLQPLIAGLLRARRDHLQQNQSIAKALDIPIRPRPDAATDLVPVRRRRPVSVEVKTQAHDPSISDADYGALIGQLASVRGLIERLPETFAPMNEESLRDLLLVILNNQFGLGSAEAFSRCGKTDITIQQDRGPIFIAECKIWSGTKAFADAIGQLLGYLVWRDTKAALVLFVREKDVTAIAEKAGTSLADHPQFVREGGAIGEVKSFILHHDGDKRRHVRVALVIVAVPPA